METPTLSTTVASPSLSAKDLARVEGALENIHMKESKSDPASLGVPPAVFGASSPMSVYLVPFATLDDLIDTISNQG